MPASVEADGHTARGSPVPTRARARRPTGHLWRLPCPSGCLSTRCRSLARAGQLVTPGACECVARPASVHGARPCLPAAGLPKGLPPTGHPAARPRGAPRRANSASQLAAARSPARLPLLLLLALLALLALPSSPSRARLSARLEGARLPGPQPPSTDSPQPGPSRAPPAALLLHIPTDLARPIIVRANVPGSERRSGGRPTCAGRPRAARAAMCPSQLVTALRHQAAAARWAPLQAPGAAGPQQGYLTAYTTRLVTSVVCRGFIPARGDIAIRQPAPGGFSPGAVASLLRYMARRPIRIQLRRAGLHRRVPARILT
ncbi:hypothetical protein KXX15_006825 [Aspergillus fumigatus]|nr:hypothetical protein KXX15_006825 [Aspergillus fumigatus]